MKSILAAVAWCAMWTLLWAAATLMFSGEAGAQPARLADRATMARLIEQVRRADYEADLAALQRLTGELSAYQEDAALASRAHYWKGFALWRRAINAMSLPNSNPQEQLSDLNVAVGEFTRAYQIDPAFADAKISAAACMMGLAFIHRSQSESEQAQAFVTKFVPLAREASAMAPSNPRVLWVMGGSTWWAPPERGGSQTRAMEIYERGLVEARKAKHDPIEPSWGEPELLMSLAWVNLNRTTPDLAAAEQYANSALQLVPKWHYVKNVLLPQIKAAQAKAKM